MKYKLPIASDDELGGVKVGNDFEIDDDGTLNVKNMDKMQETVQELVDNVGTGKALVAEAITEKGVETAEDATFQEMAGNIGQISVGVDKDYVDNADLEVKRTAAKAHSTKYDETIIPSQYDNKLYVYGNPESMYPASDIGGEIPEITQGHIEVGYNWWGQLVPNWQVQDNKIYDDIYNRLCAIKIIDQQDSDWAYWFALCFKSDESIISNPTYDNYPGENIIYGGLSSKQYFRTYSGQPPVPQEWVETTAINYITGGNIRDTANGGQNYNYGCKASGIPIFVVNNNSQTEWDKVNHYIATGDYSNAINYSELYPDNPESFTAIDVISGDWYTVVNNAWVKQGTLALNSAGGTEVEANPIGEPTDTLNTISIDGVIYGIEGGDVPVVETELIPLMTGDTTPSGTVSYSSQFGNDYAGYMAFNRQQANIRMMTGGWLPSNSDTAPYLQYTWDSLQKLSKLWIETANNGGSASKKITVQGYNGTSWENCLKSGNTVLLDFENGQYREFEIELNGQNYSAIKIEGNEQWFFTNSTACTISRMQVYSISGGSGRHTERTLYTNSGNDGDGTYTLSDSIYNYDFLAIWHNPLNLYNSGEMFTDYKMISTKDIQELVSLGKKIVLSGYGNRYLIVNFSATTFVVSNTTEDNIIKIKGIKL